MKRSISIKGRRVEYTLICARNRVRVLLQALPNGEIRLCAPEGFSVRTADDIIRQKLPDIDRALAQLRLKAQAQAQSAQELNSVLLEGRRLPVTKEKARANRVSVQPDGLHILTVHDDPEDILAQLKRHLVQLSLKRLREALNKWSPTVPVPYGRVTVREQKTRWGSCSSKHNLNFNWKLIMAPPQCLEYVVVHELCHLIHLNHSAQFWAEVAKRIPDYDLWRKWLKQHGSELHL